MLDSASAEQGLNFHSPRIHAVAEDRGTSDVIDGYRRLLRDAATLEALDLGAIVSAWRPHAGEWLSEFERRYVDLSGSEELASD